MFNRGTAVRRISRVDRPVFLPSDDNQDEPKHVKTTRSTSGMI